MVLRRQFQWFYTAKYNNPDWEQANTDQANAYQAPKSGINNPVHTTLIIKVLE